MKNFRETDAGRAPVIEAVAIFNSVGSLEETIDELMSIGFDRADVSLLAAGEAVEKRLGHGYSSAAELEDDPAVPRSSYVASESIGEAEGALFGGFFYVGALVAAGAIFASGGKLVAAILGAILAGGAFSLIGLGLARYVGKRYTRRQREQLDHGGLLLWVRARDIGQLKRAVEIFVKHSGQNVHVHTLPA
jgi:outer membrane lipoprotein SlyB